ncbi:ABC transporter permease [Streptomyces sp. GQFP]|uniref:ABC transporter permease n=1 Tax=Streptomyces sp. GQFP TaxID=2907545 RepID=UPI001F4009AA|nr:ABC transporter permease [Streptomyces sp. GQFP]UIX32367.1 FtsX-like permease family protein [Streptomyces sp. GQFP]
MTSTTSTTSMFGLAVQMVRRRISALIAVACAVLGGAALITGTGVLAESGLRSHLPAGRLAGADVIVAADQEFHPPGDLPLVLPERRTVPAQLVRELAELPGVTDAVGDLGFPAALVDAQGRVVPAGDPRAAGHGWSSVKLLGGARVEGSGPDGADEIAVDSATATAADVELGDRVQVMANARPAVVYRVSAIVDAPGVGVLFEDATAVRLAGRGGGGSGSSGGSGDTGNGSIGGQGTGASSTGSGTTGASDGAGFSRAGTGDTGSSGASDGAGFSRAGTGDTGSSGASDGAGISRAGTGDTSSSGNASQRIGANGAGSGASITGSGGDTTSASGDTTSASTTGDGPRPAPSDIPNTSNPRAGTVDLIALRTTPGAEEKVAAEVRTKLNGTGLEVVTGADRGDLVSPGAGASRSLLILLAGSLSGIVLLITGFVMASALAVSIAGQRRDLALMRAVGATPRQIRRLAAAQSSVVAAVALVPGVALGYLLAGQFRGLLADRGFIPAELPLTFSPLPALATVLLLGLVVQVSARGSAWRTSRMPATEAVAESRSEPREPSRIRTRIGVLVIVAATAMSVLPLFSRTVIGATATSLAGIFGAIGLAMAGPALVRGIGGTAARLTHTGASAPTWLAMANVRAYALRNAGIVSTLAMAVVFVLTYTLTQTTVLAATADDTRTGTLAQQSLSAPGLGGLPGGTLADVRGTSGVRAAAPVSDTGVVWTYEQFGEPQAESGSAMILTPDAADVLDLGVRDGSLSRLTGATVAVSSDAARSRDAAVGRRVSLVLGDGVKADAEVVAVYDRGLGFGDVVLSHDLVAGHTTTGLDQNVLVRTDGTADARQAVAAFAASRPGLAVEDTNPTSADGLKDAPPEVWINLATIIVLLVYLLLSIANKLVAATAQRRVELGALRLNGTTPRQIRAMMRREAAVTAATALTTALLLSAVPLALLGQGFLGRPWPAGPVWLLPALALTVTATAFLTIELPTRQALRTPPADALRAQ